MNDFRALIDELMVEPDCKKRNDLSLRLIEFNDLRLLDVLVELISRPELEDCRGTLIHCMGKFDCSKYFKLLVELVVCGNWEVAQEAYEVLGKIEELHGDQI